MVAVSEVLSRAVPDLIRDRLYIALAVPGLRPGQRLTGGQS